jgi:hypothetical protein
MGIEQLYGAFCDSCDEQLEEGFDQAWESRSDVHSAIKRAKWVERDGELLCPHCQKIDDGSASDDDELGSDTD